MDTVVVVSARQAVAAAEELACDSNVHVKTRDGDYEAFARLHILDAENRAALALCDTWRFYT